MTFWLITATLTAALTVWVLTPVMRDKNAVVLGWVLIAALPAAALLLYAYLGQPGLIDY